MDKNTRLGCLVIIFGSLLGWAIIALACFGLWELIR
jgi:hypothetical protein